jgi:kynurenine formamidase
MSANRYGTASPPAYATLPVAAPIAGRHAWGVFGDDDELGRVNLLDAAAVRRGAAEVREGRVVNLTLPLDLPDPPWVEGRARYRHTIYAPDRNSQDDYLDGFYLQSSTQWDGLRHVRARELGFYGGRQDDEAGANGTKLGIEAWAEHGLVGRGVLADVAGHVARTSGAALDPHEGTPIAVELLRETLEAAGVSLEPGDVLMVRTGYTDAYLAADATGRRRFTEVRDCPGLHAGEEMAEFLWDSGVAAVVADNPAVEVVPGSREAGSLHRRLIPLLGFALGELFVLGELARLCAEDGRFTCMFVAVPLHLRGGVGSPGNAVAVR